MVRVFDIPEDFNPSAILPQLLDRLPQWRLEKALSYRFDIDRFLCAKSFLLLEDMLRKWCGLDHCPEFSYATFGKPYLKDYPGIHFNISHCRRGVACAVSDRPVGIDIEEIQYDDSLARTVLNTEEYALVESSARKAVKFIEFWTRKESVLKLSGEGISDNVRDVLRGIAPENILTTSHTDAGYVVSVAMIPTV